MPLRLRTDIAQVDTEDGVVLLDERTGQYWQLNHTGALVLAALTEGQEPDQAARELADTFSIDPAQAHADVTAVTDQLRAAKLVSPS
jgi:hypothetical protein